jgi:coproporphyrinogen III oxidase-like Fe-S oxidoreductase
MTAPIITTHTTAIEQHTQQQSNSTLIKAFNKDSKKRLLKKAIKYVVTKNNFCDCLSFYKSFFKIKQASTVRRYRDARSGLPEVCAAFGGLFYNSIKFSTS